MASVRSLRLITAAALLIVSAADPDSICYSYGVDYVDEGSYFINRNSSESFTCVSTFQGCNKGPDPAEVLFVDPNNEEYLCSAVKTTPDDTPMLSTCPFTKNEMISGHNIILVIGNNDDGEPFAWQRDIYLTVGTQVTTTYTPTVTYIITSTPVVTLTTTSTLGVTSTVKNTHIVTLPSATAKKTQSITPPAVFMTRTKTITRTRRAWTKQLSIKTETSTATCITPAPWSHKQDKPCWYSPTLVHPAALETPTASPNQHRNIHKSDRAASIAYARARIEAAKARRDQKAKAAQFDKRSPNVTTTTVNATLPVNATITITGSPITNTESTAISTTATITLPPLTVYSGRYTPVTTLPTPTKTRLSFVYTTTTTTKTIRATFTKTVVVTPAASLKACRKQGGHYWNGRD
ncbi:uncharacterized protein CC84DRAFT_1201749 [Paraphaeosphaeria sporulosa]|uniref:Uncharacterized protein n=1 Tax=Paraphaeosphaeria sporulosa TaxID=1460663 RepID=A0A177CZ96_9PLEO|nr:uncharacterized protein CC84DRAFT_1201749 [Paraphaeosphaeria sporulosa]OAG12855.1 hypothetical protein CC84DRAFT_1201749 [Paraphaeosphaeria sporulosa]